MKIVMGVVTLVAAIILFPIILPAIEEILAGAGATHFLDDFPGVEAITGLIPIIGLIGMVGAAGFMGYQGIANKGGAYNMMRIIWGILIIFIFLTLFPLILDTMEDLYVALTSYTGVEIVTVIPLIIECGAMFSGGMLMFQGVSGKSRGGKKKKGN